MADIFTAAVYRFAPGQQRRIADSAISLITCIYFLALFCLLASPAICQAGQILSVTIQGLDGRLYDNVTASLEIFQKKEDKNLTVREIKKLHAVAEKEIKTGLEPFGFYSPVITSELKKSGDGWQAIYRVTPGEPVKVKAVSISFESKEEQPQEISFVARSFPLKKGNTLEHPTYTAGKKMILQQLFALGYLDAEFNRSEILINRDAKSAEVVLSLKIGPRYLFGKITYDQDLIQVDLIKRFINYREGEPYSPFKLSEFQRILYKTNYFGQVMVRGEIDKAEGLYVPVTVSLSPPEFYNKYSLGLGYATDDGFRGTLGWDNRLLNSRGHTITSKLKLAQRESSLSLIYGVPVSNPRFDKVLYGASYDEETWGDTDTRQLKGGINYEHAGNRYRYGGGFELRDESYDVGTESGDSFLPVPHLNWAMAYSDNMVDTRGLFVSLGLKGASEDFFGDATFIQGLFSGKIITTPFKGFRLIGRFSLGATYVDDIEDLPPSLRFYAGGDQSVRGYAYKELGPEDSSGVVIGGKYLVFASIEAEKIVSGNWSVATFFDTGSGVDELNDDLKEGAGVGLRYRLPFGQIRIDVASALSEDGNPLRVHLTVGGDL